MTRASMFEAEPLENETDPTLSTLEAIAHALGTDLHALLRSHEHSGDHYQQDYGERSKDRD